MERELICVFDDKLVSELREEAEKAFFQGIAISLSNEAVQTTGTVLLADDLVETVDGRQIFLSARRLQIRVQDVLQMVAKNGGTPRPDTDKSAWGWR
ncbi:hypothetical protein GOB44_27455 [Sinorhizobium meliloti]|nr:hypothetical protein [Sinorhizobium meliloti]MDW9713552.1 hypothetical protein [Sinorhizobium meliloti]MDW9750633.1 hypothetical protein [Sinorhizobium meliloti]MDX0252304.1 hypothetical protein [Sinorhizobium meliloti]MDX0359796.1 hypothetical protein [Sinorhizobium meliloti]